MTKVSCKTCKHYNENKINGKLVRVCTLKIFIMSGMQANYNRDNWQHYSGKFNNSNACLEWKS
jgi:hypothetical protein